MFLGLLSFHLTFVVYSPFLYEFKWLLVKLSCSLIDGYIFEENIYVLINFSQVIFNIFKLI